MNSVHVCWEKSKKGENDGSVIGNMSPVLEPLSAGTH